MHAWKRIKLRVTHTVVFVWRWHVTKPNRRIVGCGKIIVGWLSSVAKYHVSRADSRTYSGNATVASKTSVAFHKDKIACR